MYLKCLFAPVFVFAAIVVGSITAEPVKAPDDVKVEDKKEEFKDGKKPRGLKKTPQGEIVRRATKHPFVPAANVQLPSSVNYIPSKLSYWGNNQYGDCVTAEEAFMQGACGIFIPDAEVIRWARKYGFLNGAYLTEVMDQMQQDGFHVGSDVYGCGQYLSVSFGDEAILQAALSIAPVKIGIDADALSNDAGNKMGWWSAGKGRFPNEDHCVPLMGYGPVASMFAALGIETVPANWPASSKTAYLLGTWGTIGVVDHDWIMSTTAEAYVRNPTQTKNKQPQPNPGPGPNPVPPNPTPPGPNPPNPPVPGTGFTGYAIYQNGVVIDFVKTLPAPNNGVEADLKAAGVSPATIAALLQLLADVKAKKGLAVIVADIMVLIATLTPAEPAQKTGHLYRREEPSWPLAA